MKRTHQGFTLTEVLLAIAIVGVAVSLGVGSFVLSLRALRTGADALILQREADQILNMNLAPEIRLIQTVIAAGERFLVFQYQSPDTGLIEAKAFVFQEDKLYFCSYVPYTPGDPEAMEEFLSNVSEALPGVESLGRFVEDTLFSFRDGGNNLVAMTEGVVDDPTAIEIVDVRLTLARDRQVYQVTNSFIPIRQFVS